MRGSAVRETGLSRASGGTMPNLLSKVADTGLSPRERGNHKQPAPRRRHDGSIPARAGEPMTASPWR